MMIIIMMSDNDQSKFMKNWFPCCFQVQSVFALPSDQQTHTHAFCLSEGGRDVIVLLLPNLYVCVLLLTE